MIRPFWKPGPDSSDVERALYLLKGPAWYGWFLLQAKITIALWRVGAPSWVCGLPGVIMFWRWSDYWRARTDTRFWRLFRYCWRRKLGSRVYRFSIIPAKRL